MDRLANIFRWQWRIYWRQFSRARRLAVGPQQIIAILTLLVLYKYVRLLITASVDLAAGDTTLVQALLAGIFLAWLFLPLHSSRSDVYLSGLLHMPFSLRDLFAIRLLSLLITPNAWIVFVGSLAICYPLAHAPNPLAAIPAALLFITMSCSASLTIAHLLNIPVWRRTLLAMLVLLGVAIAAYIFISKDAASLPRLNQLLPTSLVANASVGRNALLSIGSLAMLNVLCFAGAWWSFRQTLMSVNEARSRRRVDSLLFGLPGAAGGLAAKDFRYFRRLLDPYFGVLAALLGCFYLVSANIPSPSVACVFIIIVFALNSPLAFNSFGLDTPAGLDRYALLPVPGVTIMRGKNLAFLIFVAMQVLPITLLLSWRLGLAFGFLSLIEVSALAGAYLTWGNWMSITLPSRMQFFRFAPAYGSLLETLAGILFGSVPGIVIVYFGRMQAERAIFTALLIALACVVLYHFATSWSGKRFERSREDLVSLIS